MRDEGSLRRLAEIGIDVYVPRFAPARADEGSAPVVAHPARAARVVLLARADDVRHALVADVRRALAFARVEVAVESTIDAGRIGDAAGLVVFGEALARETGLALPAQRQRSLAWVRASELAALGDASAKRGLWAELKRIASQLDSGPRRP